MSRIITQEDLRLTYQHVMEIYVKVEVYDRDQTYVDTLDCVMISGTFNMDANSDVRRTASLVLSPIQRKVNILIDEDSLIWINKNIVLFVGLKDHRSQEFTFYKLGTFIVMTYDSNYDATTNQLTLNCSDWVAKLDGTKNGELGALITSFPAYKEFYSTEETGGTDCHYVQNVSYSNRIYTANDASITQYVNGDYIVLQIPTTNLGDDGFRINSLPRLDIIDMETGFAVRPGVILQGYNYPFRISSGTAILTTHIPIEKVIDGVPLNYYIIRDGVITALTRLGGITDYNVDDIGEFQAMPQYNDDWENYRKENPLWNNIPYDLEFQTGDNVWSILTSFRDLYPNYEMYFDEDAVFCCNMIPSQINDDIYLTDDYLQSILISESYNIDTASVRNVCEVWGAALETDFTAESCTLSGLNYVIDIPEYGDTIFAGDRIAILIEQTNPANAAIQIHTVYTEASGQSTVSREKTFDPLMIYDEMTDSPIEAGLLAVGCMYVFKVKTVLISQDDEQESIVPVKRIYLQAEYQPQAIDVLTDGTESEETWTCADGTVVPVWSKEYFADKYGCRINNINFTVDVFSPFTIQKLGEILSVKSGGEFENITSDQRALARAVYENWKMARLIDVVNITTKLCLFMDVNKKVEYRRHDMDETSEYIVTSVSHDFSAGTSTIGMSRFRSLYMEEVPTTHEKMATKPHEILAHNTHNALGGK